VFFCCILECSDGSYYVGVTDNLEERVARHNRGRGSPWTARRRPIRLAWTEQHPTLASARKRELELKDWSHTKKAKLIRGSPRSGAADSGQAHAAGG